jgi:hypothetical protein
MVEMHMLTPNIQDVMAFPIWLNVKQNLQKLPSLKSMLYCPIWTIETNMSRALFTKWFFYENSMSGISPQQKKGPKKREIEE